MIVWKAVIAGDKAGVFTSWSCIFKFDPIFYVLNSTSKRKDGWGPLTAFKTLKHTKRFIQKYKSLSKISIIKCSATKSCAKRVWILDKYLYHKLFNIGYIDIFGNPLRGSQNLKLPAGTVLCDSITPLEVVWGAT